MKGLIIPVMASVGTVMAVYAACYVNGLARECPATVYYGGGTCNYISGILPWASYAPPGVSGRTLPCPTDPQCKYDCPHLNGQTIKLYTGGVVGSCGDPCVGGTGTGS